MRAAKYTIRYIDANGVRQTVPGYRDLGATKALAAKLEKDSARGQEGLIDPFAEHRRRPLSEHVADFQAALEAKGNTPHHVAQVVAHCQALFDGAG